MAPPPVASAFFVKGYGNVLTWSQISDDEAQARVFLYECMDKVERVFALTLGGDEGPDYISGGVEEHEDGGWHVHVGFVRTTTNKLVKVGSRLVVNGKTCDCSNHVPTSESLRACLSYPVKHDEEGLLSFDYEILEDLFDPPPGRRARANGSSDEECPWAAALNAPDYETALAILREREPKEFILKHRDIVAFFSNYFAPEFTPKYKADEFTKEPIDWDAVPLRNSVVITGPPNLGKTQYALAQLGEKPFFATHFDVLRKFNPAVHTGILLDECSTCKWPTPSFISLLDREMPRDIHVRYATVTIPAGTKKIICCNNIDTLIPEGATGDALDAVMDRMTRIEVTDRLF